ncbi:hypothetical protein OMK64_17485 [Cellulomonas fimi]|uniref:hypothetical protein n=1 Tax=Cellulomonas fimi TaxID=1708 RepID=UPI00234C94F5|nr:hypothetical protein [Cellulomonas fimi]MDC7123325.1 hypothetical protein [Cellulomonas fimi]
MPLLPVRTSTRWVLVAVFVAIGVAAALVGNGWTVLGMALGAAGQVASLVHDRRKAAQRSATT